MPKPRKESTRKPRPRILILCEGEKTEPFYFNALKADPLFRNLTSIMVVGDTRFNTAKELVNQAIIAKKDAIKDENPFFEIWVVIDKDGYTKHPEAFDRALAHNINIAFSSIAFEYWILLHFQYTTKSFSKCDDLIKSLKKNHLPFYEKKCNVYKEIKDKTCIAIENARKARKAIPDLHAPSPPYNKNPYTNIDTLICRLLHIEELKDEKGNYINIPHNNWDIIFADIIKDKT